MRLIGPRLGNNRVLVLCFSVMLSGCSHEQTVEIDQIRYHEPRSDFLQDIIDDEFDLQNVPEFVPERVASHPVHGSNINFSGTLFSLDIELLKPDIDLNIIGFHKNYRDALQSVQSNGIPVLPSVNLIDEKSRQFDERLYAALEQYWFLGISGGYAGDLDCLVRFAKAVPQDSRAAAFFSVGLQLAGVEFHSTNLNAEVEFRQRFEAELTQTKPIGFYTWNEQLQKCYRVGRFFQLDFELNKNDWMQIVIRALKQDPQLYADYQNVLARRSRLSNLATRLTIKDLVDNPSAADLLRIRRERNLQSTSISLFPPVLSRESELARRLLTNDFSTQVNLIRELVKAIRSGKVDLNPNAKSGWFDYQVFATETLLFPDKAVESRHLLRTANYKRRSLETYQASITKRKEIQLLRKELAAREVSLPQDPPPTFAPQFRIEPAPTYFLRMARSYQFLGQVLRELVDESTLPQLAGLSEQGLRGQPLLVELQQIQQLFYGCYAISAEDIGLELQVTDEERAELVTSRNFAETWLADLNHDPDMAVDTRVIVPVRIDLKQGSVANWATLGIRFCRLKVRYESAAAPRIQDPHTGEWNMIPSEQLDEATYLLPVEQWASVELSANQVFNRTEFQQRCDEAFSREDILKRIQSKIAPVQKP